MRDLSAMHSVVHGERVQLPYGNTAHYEGKNLLDDEHNAHMQYTTRLSFVLAEGSLILTPSLPSLRVVLQALHQIEFRNRGRGLRNLHIVTSCCPRGRRPL